MDEVRNRFISLSCVKKEGEIERGEREREREERERDVGWGEDKSDREAIWDHKILCSTV